MIAAVALVGRPSASSGTIVPAAEALLAASGPATPSMAPLPNSSGCLESLRSVRYDRKVGISAPPAGIAPNGKPSAVPRSQGFHDRPQSALDSHGRPTGMTVAALRRRCAATHSASPTAKMPTAMTTTSMLSARNGLPKVSRCWPVTKSVPTSAERQADQQRGEAAHPGRAEDRRLCRRRRRG